jgi:hypothetical protein
MDHGKMKKTAVEWFVNQLEKHYVFQDIRNTTAFLHAKEMEKEQIKDAYKQGTCHHGDGYTATEYYEEIFNTNEK